MKNLIELATLVNKQKIKRVEVMGNSNNYSGKMSQLYEGLISGQIETEKQAKASLYENENQDASFNKLKYRLEKRLLNTIFFIDVNKPNFNDSQRAFYNCHKSAAAVEILLGRGARKTAINLAERTLRQSMKYEYTDISLNLLKKLSRHYGVMEKSKKKYLKYTSLTSQHLEIFNAETLAEQFFNKLEVLNSNDEIILDDNLSKETNAESNQLKKYLGKVKSNRFLMFAFRGFIAKFELAKDYSKVLQFCQEALENFEKKEERYPIGIYAFTSKLIDCNIQLRQFENAEQEILKALGLINERTISWYIIYEKYMRMLYHKKDYQKAFEIFMKISVEYGFQPVYKNIREIWKIYEAYFNFFIENGKIDLAKSKYNLEVEFRLNKFLNEVPTYSSDKRGYNIPILIIQVLFYVQQKKYGKVIDKVEALNAYNYRYLKKDDTFRSNCFIKMLLLLPKCNFHKVAVERKVQPLLAKLKSVPLEVARQSAEIEIVPYEDLWEIVIGMLDEKIHKLKNIKMA